MGRCKQCGAHGFFLKLNSDGLCNRCAAANAELEKINWFAEQQRIIEEEERQAYLNTPVVKFHNHVFPMTSTDNRIQSVWNWTLDIHDDDKQFQRQKRSLYNAIPVLIDSHSFSGIFWSTRYNRTYEVTLSECTCPDFEERGLPCKHMYRLFYELTHPQLNPGITDVPSPYAELFTGLDEKSKNEFLSYVRYRNLSSSRIVKSPSITELIKTNILVSFEAISYDGLLENMTKDEIILALAKKGVQGFRPSWSKVKLIAWVEDTQQEFMKKQFKNFVQINLNPELNDWSDGIKKSVASNKMWIDDNVILELESPYQK